MKSISRLVALSTLFFLGSCLTPPKDSYYNLPYGDTTLNGSWTLFSQIEDHPAKRAGKKFPDLSNPETLKATFEPRQPDIYTAEEVTDWLARKFVVIYINEVKPWSTEQWFLGNGKMVEFGDGRMLLVDITQKGNQICASYEKYAGWCVVLGKKDEDAVFYLNPESSLFRSRDYALVTEIRTNLDAKTFHKLFKAGQGKTAMSYISLPDE
ncbi:hypothetical protein [Curvivirga aplysinae]|uniref:hypothetical protein n=1 Tax=Curvivirga aplysinae TaxID=2529852 RepID=UPI0012BC2CB1|nr:hypothetical protein [Curvivirga aplysinae]MTI09061.1 hypothetical protein [Curvivirga aplysinae]